MLQPRRSVCAKPSDIAFTCKEFLGCYKNLLVFL